MYVCACVHVCMYVCVCVRICVCVCVRVRLRVRVLVLVRARVRACVYVCKRVRVCMRLNCICFGGNEVLQSVTLLYTRNPVFQCQSIKHRKLPSQVKQQFALCYQRLLFAFEILKCHKRDNCTIVFSAQEINCDFSNVPLTDVASIIENNGSDAVKTTNISLCF